jgi:hypothetical protein
MLWVSTKIFWGKMFFWAKGRQDEKKEEVPILFFLLSIKDPFFYLTFFPLQLQNKIIIIIIIIIDIIKEVSAGCFFFFFLFFFLH